MAIHELTEEQVRTWSLEEKDRWWLANVYRGAMPQLTIRSAITGMMLGGLLSLTNLYVGAKTGWTLGVGITSVILAFAMFKVLSTLQLAQEFTILENNAMQSIATAAGYMTSPMISSLAAYMMVTGVVLPLWQTMSWISVLAILGVLFAFPFKRRFINDEQQPFPEGRAAGIVMDSLHHGDAVAGMLKAKLLIIFASLAAVVKLAQSEALMGLARIKALTVPEFLDDWFYRLIGHDWQILGTSLKSLTLRPELDLPMIGAGGLMGIRTGGSLLLGALVNYAILAPIMIQQGEIVPNAAGRIGFREITFWSLWGGVAMMTMASLMAFFAKPDILISSFTKLFRRSEGSSDVLRHIELPLSVSIVGIPIPAVYAIVLAFVLWIVSERLPLGRHVYAIGANEKAAALNGIPVRAYVIGVFVASGLITGFAGCVLAAKLRIGQANVGLDYLLPALVGAFLGSTTIKPGRVNIWGTMFGVLILAVGISGIQQLGGAFYVEPLFNGVTLVISIALAGFAQRRRTVAKPARGVLDSG